VRSPAALTGKFVEPIGLRDGVDAMIYEHSGSSMSARTLLCLTRPTTLLKAAAQLVLLEKAVRDL
jgi:hypothetical protein